MNLTHLPRDGANHLGKSPRSDQPENKDAAYDKDGRTHDTLASNLAAMFCNVCVILSCSAVADRVRSAVSSAMRAS